MNNEKQFCVVLLTILLQHVVSSPTPSHYHRGLITKRTTASASLTKLSSSSWPPKLPSYDIWGSGGIIKKNSSISKNITSLSSSVSTSASSVSHIINGNDIDDEGNMVYVDEKEILGRRRNGKVLNFFPLSAANECLSADGRRIGICSNVYECRIQGGTSSGQCALGFGVCCIFTATCEQEVFNNITYIVSPSFPALMPGGLKQCKLKIKMIDPNISQLRFDFQHFILGQPNRRTGVCDGDFLMITGGMSQDFMLCGQNSGQHMYFDVSPKSRADGIELLVNLAGDFFSPRIWEIRVSQILFEQRAPTDCMQYYSATSGIIQTFNFAENGRHLANQKYRVCIRQETGMCSIAYEPCSERSFRIGAPAFSGMSMNGFPGFMYPGMSGGNFQNFGGSSIPGFGGPSFGGSNFGGPSFGVPSFGGQFNPGTGLLSNAPPGAFGQFPGQPGSLLQAPQADESQPAANDQQPAASEPDTIENLADTEEGSGGGDGGFFGFRIPFFSRRLDRSSMRQPRQFFPSCTDRITLPCIIEDFIGTGMGKVPGCEPIHCGSALCSSGQNPCRIETSVTPFSLGIHFGDGVDKGSPEDNIGACLKYNQVACL